MTIKKERRALKFGFLGFRVYRDGNCVTVTSMGIY